MLRGAAVIFLAAIYNCLQLPAHVDSSKGETAATGLARSTFGAPRSRFSLALGDLPTALRAMLCLRALVGFLTLFLAFELRTAGSSKTSLAGLAGAALIGQLAGVTVGNRLGRRRPELLIASGLMLATAVCLLGAVAYSRTASLLVALFATGGRFARQAGAGRGDPARHHRELPSVGVRPLGDGRCSCPGLRAAPSGCSPSAVNWACRWRRPGWSPRCPPRCSR